MYLFAEDPGIDTETQTTTDGGGGETQTTTTEVAAAGATQTDGAAAAQPAASFTDLVRGAVWNDDDVPDADTVKSFTAETLKAHAPEVQIAYRQLLRERAEAEQKLADDRKAMEDAAVARQKELDAREEDIKRQNLAYTRAVADPETINKLREAMAAKPAVVDPANKDDIAKFIDAKVAEGVLNAFRQPIARHDKAERSHQIDTAFADAGLDKKNVDDFKAVAETLRRVFGTKENVAAMADAAAKTGGRSPIQIATAMVRAERDAQAARTARATETQDRIAAARAMSTGNARVPTEPTDDEIIADVFKRIGRDPDAFASEWDRNPKFKAALQRRDQLTA